MLIERNIVYMYVKNQYSIVSVSHTTYRVLCMRWLHAKNQTWCLVASIQIPITYQFFTWQVHYRQDP